MTPAWHQMVRVFGRIGLMSFGGPAAQIAVMHRELVAERPWLTEAQYLRALSFCMLLPGPEAMQLATYAGWRQRGIAGGLLAGGLFVVPGAVVIAVLALIYGTYGQQPAVQAVFVGVQATVVVIVIGAMRKLIGSALVGLVAYALALGSFLALYAFGAPFPLVIATAALVGAMAMPRNAADPVARPNLTGALRVMVIGGAIWAAPLALALAFNADFLFEIGLYFSKLAVVTFGGAYAVLAYMAQTVVQDYGWVTTTQMMDGLGLAETTPGPLILVTQMVAMLAGLTAQGTALALLAGGMALWVTFVPCFIWIFAGAPLIDWLGGQPRLQAALSGIIAAVVGVIANLSLWFAFHVFFATVVPFGAGPLSVALPEIGTFQWVPVAFAFLAAFLVWQRGWSLFLVLGLNAALGLVFHLAGLL